MKPSTAPHSLSGSHVVADRWLNRAVTLLLFLMIGSVQAHGGISALDGLLEAMIIFALLVGMALIWLGFVVYFIGAEQPSQIAIKRFRITLYTMAALLVIMAVWLMTQEGMHRDILRLLYFFILFTVLIIEITAWFTKKKMNPDQPTGSGDQ